MTEEDVGVWVGAIAQYLEKASGAVSFAELVKEAQLPMVAVWIGLLLGGFKIEKKGEFYGRSLWVNKSASIF